MVIPNSNDFVMLIQDHTDKNYPVLVPVYEIKEVKNMKIKAELPKTLSEGVHEGVIKRVEYRHEPFEYVDFWIETTNDEPKTIKYGTPAKISVATKLGKLLNAFGIKIEPNKEYDPDILVGRKVSFVVFTEETDKGTFSRIAEGSLKPVK